jgi:hypothetical protein
VKTRDCGPELTGLIDNAGEGLRAGPCTVAPRHTHRFILELPTEIPLDLARCSGENIYILICLDFCLQRTTN